MKVDEKITVNTLFGEITALPSTFLSLSIGMGEAYIRLFNCGMDVVSRDYFLAQQEIHAALKKAGYFD